MTPLRDWARLDARWYEDPVLLEAAEVCASAFHLWPVLVGKAKHESHEHTNPDGVFTATPRTLAVDAWIPIEDVRAALDALVEGELITMAVEGPNRLRIGLVLFSKWQTPRKSNAEAQARRRWIASRENALISHEEVMEATAHSHGPVMPDIDGDIEREKSANALSSASAKPKTDTIARSLFDHWLLATSRNPNQNRLTKKRRGLVRARLEDGYTVDQLKQAIDGIARSPWHNGTDPQNVNGTRYDTFDFIFRDGENVEKGIERAVGAANVAAAGSAENAALLASLPKLGGAA